MKILMKKYYSFKEVMENYCSDTINVFKSSFASLLNTAILDKAILNILNPSLLKFGEYTTSPDAFTYYDYVAEMLDEFFNRYYGYNTISIYNDDELNDERDKFIARFFNVLNVTYPIYSKLIKLYKDNENKLLGLLERNYTDEGGTTGNSLNRFNDTPQEGGDFKDENHTTNVNQIDSSTTSGLEHKEEYSNDYLINRLNDVNDKLRNLFLEWENKIAQSIWLSPMR